MRTPFRLKKVLACAVALCLLTVLLPLTALAAEDVTGSWTLDSMKIEGEWMSAALLKLLGADAALEFRSDGSGTFSTTMGEETESFDFTWQQFGNKILIEDGVATLSDDGKLTKEADDDMAMAFVRADSTAGSSDSGSGTASAFTRSSDTSASGSLNRTVTTRKGVSLTPVGIRTSTGSSWNKPEDGKVFVLVNFRVENNSSASVSISSMLSFSAYSDDSKLDFSVGALLEAEGSIDMTLDPGKNGTGEIGYEVDPNWQTLEIKFTPELFDSESYTFIFSRSDLGI